MKIITLVICFMLLSEIAIAAEAQSKVARSHRRSLSRRHHKSKGSAGSFGQGLVIGMTGATDLGDWNKCLPASWKMSTQYEDDQASATAQPQLSTTFSKITAALEKFASTLCQIRAGVKSIVGMLVTPATRKFRKKMMFMERRHFTSRAAMRRSFFGGLVDKVVSTAKSVGSTVSKVATTTYNAASNVAAKAVDGVKKVGQVIVDVAKSAWDAVSGAVKDAFMAVKDAFISVYNTIKNFLSSPLFKKLKSLFDCAATYKSLYTGVAAVVKGITEKVKNGMEAVSAGPLAIALWVADLIAALICAFPNFKTIAGYVQLAASKPNGDQDKWFYWGRALGFLLNTVASATRRFR